MSLIVTKFIGPTNHRGSRIAARSYSTAITIAWDYALDVGENHDAACAALARKLKLDGRWFRAETHDTKGYCYVRGVVPQVIVTPSDAQAVA